MSETDILRRIQMYASTLRSRLFRNQVGAGWVGRARVFSKSQTVRVEPGDVLIRGGRPVKFGLGTGSSDLVGFTERGRFLAVEVKTDTGKLTEEQSNFLDVVQNNGGLSILARSPSDLDILRTQS